MVITDLTQLDKLIKLCKKHKLLAIKIDNIELSLSPDTPKQKTKADKTGLVQIDNSFDPGQIPEVAPDLIKDPQGLTDEQRLFGSSDPSVWQTN